MTDIFRPMLAGKADLTGLKFPLLASVKLDGIRCVIRDGVALGRSLKPLPNRFVQNALGNHMLNHLDGEIIAGPPNAPDAYVRTNSGVMSVDGEPDFTYYVFDRFADPELPYFERFIDFAATVPPDAPWAKHLHLLRQRKVTNLAELRAYQEKVLEDGYEGVMLRTQDGPYKHGRSTTNEGFLLKLKVFTDGEALVLDLEEEMANTNEATINALGHTERSTHKAGKVGKGRLGALHVRDLATGVEFSIGSGFTAQQRAELWARPPVGLIVKYQHFEVGAVDKPRFPTFKGFRDPIDMGE